MKEFESCSNQVEALKEMVKDMLMASTVDPIEKLYLINSLSRLGVSYHFEIEIQEQLCHLFNTMPGFMDNKDYDLYMVGIIFQVFRSHGYKMSCGKCYLLLITINFDNAKIIKIDFSKIDN